MSAAGLPCYRASVTYNAFFLAYFPTDISPSFTQQSLSDDHRRMHHGNRHGSPAYDLRNLPIDTWNFFSSFPLLISGSSSKTGVYASSTAEREREREAARLTLASNGKPDLRALLWQP